MDVRAAEVVAVSVVIGEVQTFKSYTNADKAQALKVLEEAAEVFGAWQLWEESYHDGPYRLGLLLDECADVVQATCNLVAALGEDDFAGRMERCRKRNEARGRY